MLVPFWKLSFLGKKMHMVVFDICQCVLVYVNTSICTFIGMVLGLSVSFSSGRRRRIMIRGAMREEQVIDVFIRGALFKGQDGERQAATREFGRGKQSPSGEVEYGRR